MSIPVQSAGIYQMPLIDYINDPAPEPSANAGVLHAIQSQSPAHAAMRHPKLNPNYRAEHSSRLDLGTIAHAILLEGDERRVCVIGAEDWRTNAAKAMRDEARAKGLVPILAKDMATVRRMVEVAMAALMDSELWEDWLKAVPEQTFVWREDGAWCRARADKLTPSGEVYFEYKTTADANPASFARGPVIRMGYDIQAALAMRGVQAILKPSRRTHVFVVQEIEDPYAVSLTALTPDFFAIADERLEHALSLWRTCLKFNNWPSYPTRVCYVEPPKYYGLDLLQPYGGE